MRALTSALLLALALPTSAFAAETPAMPASEDGPTLQDLVGGRTPAQTNQRAALLEAVNGMPVDVLQRIPGYKDSNAEVIRASLPVLVNPGNANLWLPFADLVVHSQGPEASVVRVFNSRTKEAGDFGLGYSWSYGNRIQALGDTLSVIDADGGKRVFVAVDGSRRTYRLAATAQTIEKTPQGFVRTAPIDGMLERYDASGRITERLTSDGRSVKVTRNRDGHPLAIVAHNGRRIQFKTDSNGRIVEAKTDAGQVVTYRYDGTKLVSVNADGLVTNYAWDPADHMVTVDFPAGEKLELTYNPSGWLSSARMGRDVLRAKFTYDTANPANHGAEIEHNGESTRYEFDEAKGTSKITHPSGQVETRVTDPSCGCPAQQGFEGRQARYTYDEIGRLVTVRSESLNVSMQYGKRGLSKLLMAGGGNKLLFTYDAEALLTKAEMVGRDPVVLERVNGLVTGIRVGGHLRRQMKYSEAGDLLEISDSFGNRLRVEYDATGRPVVIRKNGHVKLELKYASGQPLPALRMSIFTTRGTKTSVLAREDMGFLFDERTLQAAKKKASLDSVPGTKLAGPVVVIGGFGQWWTDLVVPGPSPCPSWWETVLCEASVATGCMLPEIFNTLVPFGGLFNPWRFNAETGEFESTYIDPKTGEYTSPVLDLIKNIRNTFSDPGAGFGTADAGKDVLDTAVNGNPISGIGPGWDPQSVALSPEQLKVIAEMEKRLDRLAELYRQGDYQNKDLLLYLAQKGIDLRDKTKLFENLNKLGKIIEVGGFAMDLYGLGRQGEACAKFAENLNGCP